MRQLGGNGQQAEVRGALGPAVELRGVRRQYGRGSGAVHALAGVDLALSRGTFTAVMRPSGSGKSSFAATAVGLSLLAVSLPARAALRERQG